MCGIGNLDAFSEKGLTPNFAGLLGLEVYQTLESIDPPDSPMSLIDGK